MPGGAATLRIACAGWSLPRESWPQFPEAGTHLERYAGRLVAAEINSSFYRPHQPATYAGWAGSVPPGFRFSVKLPKTITHEKRLRDCGALLDDFLLQAAGLGDSLGCLLVQLPPSLAFDKRAAVGFFTSLRKRHAGAVALEPRHASWFTPEADTLLKRQRIGRVLADPVLHDAGSAPGGWPGLVYLRLHGSPRMYYSSYAPALLQALAAKLREAAECGADVWCIFDNTASGAAVSNALELQTLLER
ncbi:MAG: DUF72 domain-containing protein [Pseudomonadota bacterium]|uniref:DUF72 domain-containing protein n=1 Tax=Polaromonas sp. TaxID=1869339 RepID=UPI0017CD1582|nr:DUF72 domain-containing protein [Polaromonas sp.]MBA3593286.1 DUF72 domain-containing protein [Polaromonas sp.]MDQ3271469.1 DUF72 domain-containing protein [Pseudomonadota bacterium]